MLVGDDGRVRVLDFGLVTTSRASAPPPAGGPADSGALGRSDLLSVDLTTAGSILGTPAYMAPEQYQGAAAGARADQFSFCVCLYEALYGERPFPGETLQAIAESTLSGSLRDPARGARVPSWLRRAVGRGLAASPSRRWPTMDALLAELTRDRGRARRRALSAAVVVTGLGLGVYGLTRAGSAADERACADADEQLSGAWDDARRGRLREVMLGSELAYAADTWSRVERGLDRYAAAYLAEYRGACEARAAAEPGDVVPDLRIACLQERRAELSALVEGLEEGDARTIELAVDAVSKHIKPVESCERVAPLASRVGVASRADASHELAAIREGLARGRGLLATGRYRDALTVATRAVSDAEATQVEALLAEALLLRGDAEEALGEASAVETYARAVELAHASGNDEVTLVALRAWIYLTGARRARHEVARTWYGLARATVTRAGVDGRGPQVALLNTMAGVELDAGDYARARSLSERALALQEQLRGPKDPRLTITLNGLGAALAHLGEYERAGALLDRASAIEEEAYGPLHPSLAVTLHNFGALYVNVGRHEQGRPFLERALEIRARALGPSSPRLLSSLTVLGLVHSYSRRYDEAQAMLERAVSIAEAQGAAGRSSLADALTNLGVVYSERGDDAGALDCWRRALETLEALHGPEHSGLYTVLNNLGVTQENLGRFDEARAYYERAYELRARAVGDAHPSLGFALLGLGELELAAGEHESAVARLERVLELWTKYPPRAHSLAKARFSLARARWQLGQRERALELGRAAREDLFGDTGDGLMHEIEAWLAARAGAR